MDGNAQRFDSLRRNPPLDCSINQGVGGHNQPVQSGQGFPIGVNGIICYNAHNMSSGFSPAFELVSQLSGKYMRAQDDIRVVFLCQPAHFIGAQSVHELEYIGLIRLRPALQIIVNHPINVRRHLGVKGCAFIQGFRNKAVDMLINVDGMGRGAQLPQPRLHSRGCGRMPLAGRHRHEQSFHPLPPFRLALIVVSAQRQ